MAAKKRKTKDGPFTEEQKAQFYAWECATCALTGANLWVLDYGASPIWQYDWADHIRPLARDGRSTLHNGISVSYDSNYTKGANGRSNNYIFAAGRPTWRYFALMGQVTPGIAAQLRRDVKPIDWYFNRVLAHVMQAVDHLTWNYKGYKRNDTTHLATGFEFLKKWHKAGGTAKDFRERGLWPRSLSRDQKRMLDVAKVDVAREDDSVDELHHIARDLAPYYRANEKWLQKMSDWSANCSVKASVRLLAGLRSDKHVTPAVRTLVRNNVSLLKGCPPARERTRPIKRTWDDFCSVD